MNKTSLEKTTLGTSYGARVSTQLLQSGEYVSMKAPVKNVISFSGSYINIPDFASGQELIRDLTISMLDKGTEVRSKSELARAMEGIGAQITFSTDGIRTRVSGRCMAADIRLVLGLLAEQLLKPSFPEREFALLKGRYEASLQRSLTDTASLADGALSRRIYGSNHPSFVLDSKLELEKLSGVAIDDIQTYFREKVQMDEWKLALVGDTDFEWLEDVANEVFEQTAVNEVDIEIPEWSEGKSEPGMEQLFVQDRENINVYMGHAVRVSPTDKAYLPLYIGNYILGGNFSARLMNVIRDELGLTYGIQSSLVDLDTRHFGAWKVSVTLSQDALEQGIAETQKQIARFVTDGVTDEEVEEKKETVAGLFQVGLSSTRNLASALIRNCEKRRDPSYLDKFPQLIGELVTSDINSRIREHFHPDQLHTTMAGTIN